MDIYEQTIECEGLLKDVRDRVGDDVYEAMMSSLKQSVDALELSNELLFLDDHGSGSSPWIDVSTKDYYIGSISCDTDPTGNIVINNSVTGPDIIEPAPVSEINVDTAVRETSEDLGMSKEELAEYIKHLQMRLEAENSMKTPEAVNEYYELSLKIEETDRNMVEAMNRFDQATAVIYLAEVEQLEAQKKAMLANPEISLVAETSVVSEPEVVNPDLNTASTEQTEQTEQAEESTAAEPAESPAPEVTESVETETAAPNPESATETNSEPTPDNPESAAETPDPKQESKSPEFLAKNFSELKDMKTVQKDNIKNSKKEIDNTQKIRSLKLAEKHKIDQKIKTLKAELDELNAQYQYEQTVAKLNGGTTPEQDLRISDIKNDINKVETEIDKSNKKLSEINAEIDKIDSTLANQRKNLNEMRRQNGRDTLRGITDIMRASNEKFKTMGKGAYVGMMDAIEKREQMRCATEYALAKASKQVALEEKNKLITHYTKQNARLNGLKNVVRTIIGDAKVDKENIPFTAKQMSVLAKFDKEMSYYDKAMESAEKQYNVSKDRETKEIETLKTRREDLGMKKSMSFEEKLEDVKRRSIEANKTRINDLEAAVGGMRADVKKQMKRDNKGGEAR